MPVMNRKGLLIVSLLLLVAVGCGGPVVKNPTLVGAPGTQRPSVESQYQIQVADTLDIKFFYNPELNEQIMVRPDGKISLQLIDEVVAAGKTPSELTSELKTLYANDLANPQLTVIVRSFAAHKVYVDGEVYKPGLIPLLGPMTVMQSIAYSGGLKESARPNEVVVIRRTAENEALAIPVNLTAVVDGTAMGQDLSLAPFDIVFIPKSPIAIAGKWVDEYLKKVILVLPQEFFLYYSAVTR